MNGQPGWIPAALLAVATLALTACSDAITVHSLAQGLRADLDLPAIAGRWQLANGESGAPLLVIDHRPGDTAPCRAGLIQIIENGTTTAVGDEVCFVEVGGQLIAELRTTEPLAGFYRQLLVRITGDRIELCGPSVWVMLSELEYDRPTGYAFDELQYTVRAQGSTDLMVVISKPPAMLAFLETALPELGAACDRGGELFEWKPFEPAPQQDPDEAAEGPADAAG